ncbi:MAG: hypothetical protein L6R43_06925 [Planctomycetes bacterium]|nr:hypothetical protein [Planctomycetota bacterium]
MRLGWLFAAALLAAGAVPALAQDKNLVGQDAPEIQTKEWINGDGRSAIADFKGEVVLIEAWATW